MYLTTKTQLTNWLCKKDCAAKAEISLIKAKSSKFKQIWTKFGKLEQFLANLSKTYLRVE